MSNETKVFTPLSVVCKQMENGFPYWFLYEPDGTALTENSKVNNVGEAYELLTEAINELEGQFVLLTIRNTPPPRKDGGEDALEKSAKKTTAADKQGNGGKTFKYRIKLNGYLAQPVGGGGINGMGGGGNALFQMLLDNTKTIAGLEAARREDALQRQIDELKKEPKNNGSITSQLIDKTVSQLISGLVITKDGISFNGAPGGITGGATGGKIEANTQEIPEDKKTEAAKRFEENIKIIGSKLKGNDLYFYEGIRKLAETQPEIFEAQAAEIINVGKG